MNPKKGLGKGLNILIPDMEDKIERDDAIEQAKETIATKEDVAPSDKSVVTLKIGEVEPNREQPRRIFNKDALDELADSIKTYGIIQPIIVRKNDGYYEIVAGERRWRAARLAGLTDLPVIVKDYDELKALEISLIENIQREDLSSVEEATTYRRLIDEFNLTQDEIASRVGKKRSTVANVLRLLNLPKSVQDLVDTNKITAGHAKALLAVDDSEIQQTMADKIVEGDLSVRQVEAIMKKLAEEKKEESKETESPFSADNLIYYKSIERELNNLFGTKVKVSNGKNKGKIEIEYFSDSDLNRLMEMFKKTEGYNGS